ncbi:MAG: TolB family protein, partial [Rudaea sp.]
MKLHKAVLHVLAMFAALSVGALAHGQDTKADGDALPLLPTRHIRFDTDEGTWISLDVSPDGRSIVFELLGDLYRVGIDGGEATAITHGLPFDSQPRFSPDGSRIVFVSDRSGNENVWIANADGTQGRQISRLDDNAEFTSPAWSADGRSITVSVYHSDLTAYELWRYAVDGNGNGERVTKAKSYDAQPKDGRYSALDANASRDGKWLWFAGSYSRFDEDMTLPMWSIHRLDIATAADDTIVTNQGSAMTPVVSPDGATLVYAARYRGETELRVRDLHSGADRELIRPVQHDDQEGLPSRGLMPGYAFTPDGRSL